MSTRDVKQRNYWYYLGPVSLSRSFWAFG
uniref:Uncharacterized protein n=1 Tax=Arundo donax TaxID=35708 RepID=A0A0A9U1K5_ARUDO